MVVVIVMRVRRQDVRWRRAAMVGVVGMALAFLASLNEFPLRGIRLSHHRFLQQLRRARTAPSAAERAGRGRLAVHPRRRRRTALSRSVRRTDLARQSVPPARTAHEALFPGRDSGRHAERRFSSPIRPAFYIVAYKFGAWSPADVPYSDLLNTEFPWLFVLFGGYLPAVSEEFMFRMFAIPFLRKLVRWLPAAVVLAGFIWGFGHAGYPQQPFFIRGVEVGIGGVALGIIMLRWGILPTLVWHYSVDAMYSAMLLLRSHSLYFKLSGAASAGILVVPIVVALVAYWRAAASSRTTGLLNRDEPAARRTAGARPQPRRPPHPRTGRSACAHAPGGRGHLRGGPGDAGAFRAARFGDSPRYKLTPARRAPFADAFLRAPGHRPRRIPPVVTFPPRTGAATTAWRPSTSWSACR